MFNMLTKYFAAPCILGLFFGCGKEIKTTQQPGNYGGKVINRHELNAKGLTLEVGYNPTSDVSSATVSYKTERSGWLTIPAQPTIEKGDALVITSRIFINGLKNNNSITENLYCDYKSIKINIENRVEEDVAEENIDKFGYYHTFLGCKEDVDNDGEADQLNYEPGDRLPIDEARFISVEIKNSDSKNYLEFKSEIDVDWH